VCLRQDDIANNRNCQQSASCSLSRRRRGISVWWVAAIVIYPACLFAAAGQQRYPTPARSIGSPLSRARRPTITLGDFTAGWAFDVQQLDKWSRYPTAVVSRRTQKNCRRSDSIWKSKPIIYRHAKNASAIKHKKMPSTCT